VFLLIAWLEGRIESPASKEARISAIVAGSIASHSSIPGHSVMIERVNNYGRDIREIKEELKEIRHLLEDK